jgi:hypothetical protein
VWLNSQLILKEHHAIRLKEGKKAMGRLRRLTGKMGLARAGKTERKEIIVFDE